MHALALDSCNDICYKTPEEATVHRVVSVPLSMRSGQGMGD